jgi:hypothetical protein
MIVVRILGGLGNQMFQYAAGRALAAATGVPLRVDLQDLGSSTSHGGYALADTFGLQPQRATRDDLRAVLGARYFLRRLMLHRRGSLLRNGRVVVEPHFRYWPGLWSVRAPCYLSGYWQSPMYFGPVAAQIRSDFAFPWSLSPEGLRFAETIASSCAVSIHVRRGDYAANPATLKMHGLCSLDYYQRAISHIASRVERPKFFVFSDDMEWSMANLKIPFETCYVGAQQKLPAREDLRLMSLCRHHVIANSTFSWWAAWLNSRVDKIVCAPQQWFADSQDVGSLFPTEWHLL